MPTSPATLTSSPCGICGFPILIPETIYKGQQIRCPNCHTINEAIADVIIPTPVFVGFIAFGLGVLLGPSFWAATKGGSEWLARKAKERIK